MQLRTHLAFRATGTHFQVILSFLSTKILKSFSSRAALHPFSTQPVFVLGITSTMHLASLNFVGLALSHPSSLSRSLWMAIPSLLHVTCTTQLGDTIYCKWKMLCFPHPFEVRGKLCSHEYIMETCAYDMLRFYRHTFRVSCHLLKNCGQINPQSTWLTICRYYFVLYDRKNSLQISHFPQCYLFSLKLLSI